MATNYSRGADYERRVKARLEADGWTVFRTAGSKSPCDLIAVRWNVEPPGHTSRELVFVQVKSGVRNMTAREREAFATFARDHGARPLLVSRGMRLEWLDEVAPASQAREAA